MKGMRVVPNRGSVFVFCCVLVLGIFRPLESVALQEVTPAARWPSVAPAHTSVVFADGENAGLVMEVLSIDGRSLYQLECRTFAFTSRLFNYSGDFECRLFDPNEFAAVHSATLLADAESTREWDTRGRFLRDEVEGECGEYPEYGRVRHFRLRGMELTLTLADIVFQSSKTPPAKQDQLHPSFRSFRFEIQIRPEPAATSAVAELPPVLNPLRRQAGTNTWKRDCRTVVPRH